MTKVYFCTLCEKTWLELSDDAVPLTTKRGGNGTRTTYRFADGSIHVIKQQTAKNADKEQQ
jgi:hypothetical protein